jgi:hypothetical protein
MSKVSRYLSFPIIDQTFRLINLSGRAFSQIGILAWPFYRQTRPVSVSHVTALQMMDEFRAEHPTLKVHQQFRVRLQLCSQHQSSKER